MKKILFINLPLRPGSKRRHLPVGLAYIITAVIKAGFKFDLIDMDIDDISLERLENILSDRIYDIYAFGCIVTGFKLARQISKIIKKNNPNSIVIAGNSVASSIPELLLSNSGVDIAVMGEGDVAIVELLGALESKKSISSVKGIAFKENGKIIFSPKRPVCLHLDSLGFPEWEIFELNKYNKYGNINVNNFSSDKVLSYPLNSARGCPFDCTFCYHVFKGERYRRYSEDKVIEEIKRLYTRYGCNFISFWDELTFPDIKCVERMVQKINSLNLEIKWEATTRAGLFKKEDFDLVRTMKKSGCENIAFSLENADSAILAAMHKEINPSQFIEQAKVLWEGGIVPLTSVIFGYPQETAETIRYTIKICEECRIYPSVGFLLPLPATPIYEWAKKTGRIRDEIDYLESIGDRQDFHINLTQMPEKEFIDIVESELRRLALKLGLKLESVFKTTTYQRPKDILTDSSNA